MTLSIHDIHALGDARDCNIGDLLLWEPDEKFKEDYPNYLPKCIHKVEDLINKPNFVYRVRILEILKNDKPDLDKPFNFSEDCLKYATKLEEDVLVQHIINTKDYEIIDVDLNTKYISMRDPWDMDS